MQSSNQFNIMKKFITLLASCFGILTFIFSVFKPSVNVIIVVGIIVFFLCVIWAIDEERKKSLSAKLDTMNTQLQTLKEVLSKK